MTLGEKIKQARTESGFTQAELAEKLMVSRQAITKWEADKGIPDITNLKALVQLLQVSLDYLLDDGKQMDDNVIRERIDLSKYGKSVIKKRLLDRLMKDKFKGAEIHTLMPQKKRDKVDKVVDEVLFWTTPLPGITGIINSLKLVGKENYLVMKDNKQYFISVSYKEGFMETRTMLQPYDAQNGKCFEIGDMKYTDCGPIK